MSILRTSLIAVMLISWSCAVFGESNEDRVKAYDLYSDGYDKYVTASADDNSALTSAENLFMRARWLVKRDTDSLYYTTVENKVIPGTGRWPKFENVTIKYNKNYKPNEHLRSIRQAMPPGFEVYSWRVDNALYVRIKNIGESRVENLSVSYRSGQDSKKYVIEELMPSKENTIKFSGRFSGSIENVTLNFGELYDFVPAQIQY